MTQHPSTVDEVNVVRYQNFEVLSQLNNNVTRQVDFDGVNVGDVLFTTLLVFSHHLEGSYVGGVAHLECSVKVFEEKKTWFIFFIMEKLITADTLTCRQIKHDRCASC